MSWCENLNTYLHIYMHRYAPRPTAPPFPHDTHPNGHRKQASRILCLVFNTRKRKGISPSNTECHLVNIPFPQESDTLSVAQYRAHIVYIE